MRKVIILLAIILMSQNSSVIAQVQDATLNNLIEKAIEVSPKLEALKNKQLAAEAEVPQVSNLPDPMLTLGLANLPTNSFSFTQEPMTGKIVGLSQAVPFPGKLNAMGNVKSKNSEIIQQEIDDTINEIRMQVAKNYYDLANVRETIEVTLESKRLLESITQVVKTKYQVSKASQQNLIQVQAEITRIEDKLKKLESKERTLISNINALILENSNAGINTSKLKAIAAKKFTVNYLDSLAREYRPFLKGVKLREEQTVLMKDLAEYEFYPNFNLRIQYSQRDEIARTNTDLNDFLSFMVGISLPINYGGKKSAAVEEAELKRKMFESQYESARQMLFQKFGSSISSLQELEEREELIANGLLPQTEQTYYAAMSAYQVNEIDFINVLDAQNKLLQVEIELFNIRSEYYKEISNIEFLVGTDIK
ncbi:MAG: TolC family protein [Melioribacteraceae bacterium]|nr:TolC family protein [Melioribacteraceae bacterium]MCO6472982.1 TolC family protein [Melioribacteraceae bacterium]MDD3557153.1 TolC family protein [Melioribacteraceae bacterium]GJQ64265.1 MAG: PTS cellobiose transporter subunit IIC [Melioribacteraceae bacterium]